jgi:hypothetical protein
MTSDLYRGAAALGIGLLLSLFVVPSAYAHAAYESSDPANESTVSSPPSRVTAEFTEPVVDDSRLEVFDPCGEQVDNGDSLVAADRITVSMSADKQGTYRVHFSVVSSVDGHPTSGDFIFTSSGGAPCPAEEPAEEEEPSGGGSGGGNEGAGGNSEPGSGSAGETGGDQTGTGSARRADGRRAIQRSSGDNRGPRSVEDRVKASRVEREPGDVASAPTAISMSGVAGIWEGIDLSQFLIALLVAAVIGAAGGFVYAGIMGPKR